MHTGRNTTAFALAASVALLAAAACEKGDGPVPSRGGEIVLAVDPGHIDMDVESKASATAITAVPSSLYWGASTGAVGSDVVKWAAASKAVSSSKIATGQYQTATPTTYNYYVANQSFTIPASAGAVTMTVSNNATDVICGRASSSAINPSVTLGHIFARTGTLTATAPSGFTASNVSWKIVGKSAINGTAGTYNLSTGAWTAASAKLTTAQTLTSSATAATTSDLYLIPGTYTITVTYTLTKGDNVQTYTKSGDVTLVAGKRNNISCTLLSNTVSEITLNVSLTAWSDQAVTLTLS